MEEEFVVRGLDVGGERAREREIRVRILIAPERGRDRRDDERDLAVGETEKSGSAAFEDIGVRALRLPRERVERGERRDTAERAGENAGEEAEGFCERFGALVGFGDEIGWTAQFVRDIRDNQSFRDVMQSRE